MPEDKLFQSKEIIRILPTTGRARIPREQCPHGTKVQARQHEGLSPPSFALLGLVNEPRYGRTLQNVIFARGARLTSKPHVAASRALTSTQVLLLQTF